MCATKPAAAAWEGKGNGKTWEHGPENTDLELCAVGHQALPNSHRGWCELGHEKQIRAQEGGQVPIFPLVFSRVLALQPQGLMLSCTRCAGRALRRTLPPRSPALSCHLAILGMGKKKSLFSFIMIFMHFCTPHSFLSSGAFRKHLGKESGCGALGQ